MLNRREVCSFLSGIPLVGWMFSTGNTSERTQDSKVLPESGFNPIPKYQITLADNEDGSTTAISTGEDFVLLKHTKDSVTEISVRRGKIVLEQTQPIKMNATIKPFPKPKKTISIEHVDPTSVVTPENPEEYTTTTGTRNPKLNRKNRETL